MSKVGYQAFQLTHDAEVGQAAIALCKHGKDQVMLTDIETDGTSSWRDTEQYLIVTENGETCWDAGGRLWGLPE